MSEKTDEIATSETPESVEPTPVKHPWSDLSCEQFSLLRLNPQVADKATGIRPLRFAQLGRVERHSAELSFLRLSVVLPDQRPNLALNTLDVWVNHHSRSVRFGPEDGLITEPANRGLGRFILAQGIGWARKQWAYYLVESGPLPTRDNFDAAAIARRNHALQAQGFNLSASDPLQMHLLYSASRVQSLQDDWNTEKVQIIEQLDAANMLELADKSFHEHEVKMRKMQEKIDRLSRDDNGLRFSLTCLLAFCLFQAGLLFWMATR